MCLCYVRIQVYNTTVKITCSDFKDKYPANGALTFLPDAGGYVGDYTEL